MDEAARKRIQIESEEREKKQFNLVKWDLFRERRDIILSRYIELK